MNCLDMIVFFILIYTVTKGLRLGLILSIFNIVQIILSIIITRRYYPYIYRYINNNPNVYNIIGIIIEFILKILFYSKSKEEVNFVPDLISKGLLKLAINFFTIILLFWLVNIIINLILDLFSFILKIPVLKQLNEIGGIIFGLIEGAFIVYLLNIVLYPIASAFPKSFIGKSILSSAVFNYLNDINLILDIFPL